MKKCNIIILVLLVAIAFSSCEQYEDYKTDYKYSTVYFPYQQPLRTVVMGEGLDFEVGVVLGGRRDNQQRETVQYELDISLLAGTGLRLLPEEYYTLSDESQMVIPSGSIFGRVTVNLDSSQFVNDSLSYQTTYALPLRITESSVDSVLQGEYNEATGEYEVAPKDYTVVAIKYINPYHGTYYHKGVDYTYNSEDQPVDTSIYSFPNLVNNFTWKLETRGPQTVMTNGIGGNTSGDGGTYAMKLNVDGTDVTLENVADGLSDITSVGGNSASYDPENETFYLEYSYTDNQGLRHEVSDTLIFRDHGLEFETW